ncbi:LEA type 2 family protein [Pseudaeromonas sp. ZJS20]|uniref:LEA type 2 family protein n=1 Tax=Pseudaeromonas aegiceratis TaxID=3153928 RepID=UPI00390CAFD3
MSRLLVLCCLLLSACASLNPVQAPKVLVNSVALQPQASGLPQLAISLHLSNPNDRELSLRGASYDLSVEGHALLSGVANQLPVLPAYGEADVTLLARPDMLGALALAQQLLSAPPKEGLGYQLHLVLDAGALLPNITLEKAGRLGSPTSRQ